MTIIKKGYRITVTSWENDADNYNTKTMDGFTKEEAHLFIDIFKLFYSKNNRSNKGCFGNIYSPTEAEMKAMNLAFIDIFSKHPTHEECFPLEEDEVDLAQNEKDEIRIECVMDMLYDFGLRGEFFARVLDSYTVEFVEQDIHIQDVTSEF